MSTTHQFQFGTQLIGQTEKALNAILDRLLDSSEFNEPLWVALRMTAMSGGAEVDYQLLVERLEAVFNQGERHARRLIDRLQELGAVSQEDDGTVNLTEAGRARHDLTLAAINATTERLWGDIERDQLDVAARVLTTVMNRAHAELY